MSTTKRWSRSVIGIAMPLLFAMPLAAHDDTEKVVADLSSYQEVPTLSSGGTATFHARIADDDQSFDWVLTYSGLANVTQAHIHFGAQAIAGPIVIFLCTNLTNPPPAPAEPTQPCPAEGTVTGTAKPGDVTAGGAALGIPAGNFAKMLDAIRAGAAYANVHTTLRPGGEVRGQIHSHEDHDN